MTTRLANRIAYFDAAVAGHGAKKGNPEASAVTNVRRYMHQLVSADTDSRSPSNALRHFLWYAHNVPGYTPSYFQRLFFKESARVLAPAIMRDCDAEEQARTMQEFSLEPLDTPFLFGETGRRMGKTDAVTQVLAALLLSVPHITVAFFTLQDNTAKDTCNKASSWLTLLNTDEFAAKIGNAGFEVHKTMMHIILVNKSDPTDVRTVNFFGTSSPNVILFFYFYIFCTCGAAPSIEPKKITYTQPRDDVRLMHDTYKWVLHRLRLRRSLARRLSV